MKTVGSGAFSPSTRAGSPLDSGPVLALQIAIPAECWMQTTLFAEVFMMNRPIVRAVDTGYGNTKFSLCDSSSADGIKADLFPSLAPPYSPVATGMEQFTSRDTKVIEVGTRLVEVGKDVRLAMSTRSGRTLHKDFSTTDTYMALTRGAMAYMNLDRIDLLVVGLPVQAVSSRQEALVERLKGNHPMPNGKKLWVQSVQVLAQPIGGFMDYAQSTRLYETMRNERNLLIDVGFFTTDWVTAQGIRAMPQRCGSYNLGASEILKRTAAALSQSLGIEYSNIDDLDEGFRTGRFKINGSVVDLNQYRGVIDSAVDEAVDAMLGSVSELTDIDNVVVCGGGAHFFVDRLKSKLQRDTLHVVNDAVTANVRGFQLIGEAAAKKMRARLAERATA